MMKMKYQIDVDTHLVRGELETFTLENGLETPEKNDRESKQWAAENGTTIADKNVRINRAAVKEDISL